MYWRWLNFSMILDRANVIRWFECKLLFAKIQKDSKIMILLFFFKKFKYDANVLHSFTILIHINWISQYLFATFFSQFWEIRDTYYITILTSLPLIFLKVGEPKAALKRQKILLRKISFIQLYITVFVT